MKKNTKKNKGFFWHLHHDILCEYSANIEKRIKYIKKAKPTHEITLRLQLLKKVKGLLPKDFTEATIVFIKKHKACNKALETCGDSIEAWYNYLSTYEAQEAAKRKFNKMNELYKSEIEALHKLECPGCPWNGHTIFP